MNWSLNKGYGKYTNEFYMVNTLGSYFCKGGKQERDCTNGWYNSKEEAVDEFMKYSKAGDELFEQGKVIVKSSPQIKKNCENAPTKWILQKCFNKFFLYTTNKNGNCSWILNDKTITNNSGKAIEVGYYWTSIEEAKEVFLRFAPEYSFLVDEKHNELARVTKQNTETIFKFEVILISGTNVIFHVPQSKLDKLQSDVINAPNNVYITSDDGTKVILKASSIIGTVVSKLKEI